MSVLTLSARLDRTDGSTPWGFRLHGGADFRAPLTIQRVTPGSLAAKCGLQVGDAILKIGATATDGLPHKEAQQQIVGSGNSLELTLQRGGGILQSVGSSAPAAAANPAPSYAPPSQPAPQGYAPPAGGFQSPAADPSLQANYNTAPKPFTPGGGGGAVPVAMNKQYNTPLNMYSVDNVMDSLSGQAQQMNIGGAPGGGAGSEESPPPLPSSAPPPLPSSAPPPAPSSMPPPPESLQVSAPPPSQTMHVPGVRSVKPNLSPKPVRHVVSGSGRNSPLTNVSSPKPFNPASSLSAASSSPSVAPARHSSQDEELPGYMGLSSSTTAQSRKFKELQRMVDSGEDLTPISRRPTAPVTKTQTPPTRVQTPPTRVQTPPTRIQAPPTSSQATPTQRLDASEETAGKYVKAIVNKQYNTPKGLYSNTTAEDTFSMQSTSILKDMQRDTNDTITVEDNRKKIYVPSETRRIVRKEEEPEVEVHKPSAVNAVFSALASGSTGYKDSSPISSDRGYGSDRGSDTSDGNPDGKKVLYASDTFRAVKEEEERRPSFGSGKPAQSRTLNMLQKQLDGGGGGAPAPAAPRAAPAAAPPAMAPAAARPGAGGPSSWAPKIPVGPRKMKLGRVGDAKSMPAAGGGGRVPMCSSCGVAIRGPFISALDKTWCPAHFQCANPQCRRELIGIGFVEEGGHLYCERDYEMYLAPPCGKCGSKIVGSWVSALECKFHPHCFLCTHCRQPIGDGKFHVQDGEPFCAKGKEVVNAMKDTFHMDCFTCVQCRVAIGTGSFHIEEGKVYCQKDWAQLFQTKCYGCQFPIEPGDRWVEALNENWHSECFNCSTCQCNLEGQPFFAKQGKPYCKKHAMTPRF